MKPSIHWLFVFIPITLILDHAGNVPPPVIFFSAALAIVPVASLIVRSTEQLAARTGDAVGGLLNATFGNAPELIIALVALKAGYADMVRASIIGAILANLLLALGMAFFLGGLRHLDQKYNPAAARLYSSMMLLAAASLAVPSAFSRYFAPEGTIRQEELLNLGIAGVLLLTYGLYLLFSLKTHRAAFASVGGDEDELHDGGKRWSMPLTIFALAGASVLAAWMSEILVGVAEATGKALHVANFHRHRVPGDHRQRRGEWICHRPSAEGQNGFVRGHRTWKLDSDCVVRCTGARVRELPDWAAAAGTFIRPRGGRLALHRCIHRHDRLRGRPFQLV
jgi:Ca2+:H+ antiporter